MTDSMLGPASMAITLAVSEFHNFLPPLADIRQTNPHDNPGFVADVRVGEFAAVAVTIGVGIMITSLTRSPIPTVAGIVTSIGLVVLYESILRQTGI